VDRKLESLVFEKTKPGFIFGTGEMERGGKVHSAAQRTNPGFLIFDRDVIVCRFQTEKRKLVVSEPILINWFFVS